MSAVLSQSKKFHGQVLYFSVFGIIYLVLLHLFVPPSYYFGYHSFPVSFFTTYVDAGRNGLYESNHTKKTHYVCLRTADETEKYWPISPQNSAAAAPTATAAAPAYFAIAVGLGAASVKTEISIEFCSLAIEI